MLLKITCIDIFSQIYIKMMDDTHESNKFVQVPALGKVKCILP